jgi:hypothetical protein
VIRLWRRWRDLRFNLDWYERELAAAIRRHEAGGFAREYDIARGQLAMVQMFRKIVEGE